MFFRRSSGDHAERLQALEESMASVIRQLKADKAALEARLDAVWTMALPAWIREAVPHAERNGWRVEPTKRSLIFRDLE